MFDQSSRYNTLDDITYEAPDGHIIVYKPRRFLPPGNAIPLLQEVTVNPGDRLDLITARILGDPLQYWQVCDANNCMNPFALTDDDAVTTRRQLRVPVPQFQVRR
jgi:hypothetical protein